MINRLRRKGLLVLGLVAGTSALAHVWRPTIKLADQGSAMNLETLIPSSFGDWRIDDSVPVILPSPDVLKALNKIYNQTLARTYVNSRGDRVMLSIAYGGDQSDGMSAHWPQSCYRGQGFAITSDRAEMLSVAANAKELRVRRLVAEAGARREPITYWILLADETVLSGTEMKLAQLKYGIRGLIPDGILFRVSSIARDPVQAYEVHDRFVRELHSAMNPADLPRLFGAA